MNYALAGSSEAQRQSIQAQAWEKESEIMLDRIGVLQGWSCLDLGCGARGILGPLSRRAGDGGRVIGLELDVDLAAAAEKYAGDENLKNVVILQRDILENKLPRASFDLVHTRWVLAHVPDPEAIIREMLALVKPGGFIAIEEPDHASMNFYPGSEKWLRLRVILESLVNRVGDANIGRRAFELMRGAGIENIDGRACIIHTRDNHPYMRMPLLAIKSIRDKIVEAGLCTRDELDELVDDLEKIVADPATIHVSLITLQVWGRK